MTLILSEPKSTRIALNRYVPALLDSNGRREAAVAAVIRRLEASPELLFIERAASPNDPWSGQVAFPGGRREPFDTDLCDAAIRETEEEIGVVLSPAMRLGRLNDQQGSNRNRKLDLVIGCYMFEYEGDPEFNANYEVAAAFWVGLDALKDPRNRISHQTDYRTEPFPGVEIGEGRVLWGLTLRFVSELLTLLEADPATIG